MARWRSERCEGGKEEVVASTAKWKSERCSKEVVKMDR